MQTREFTLAWIIRATFAAWMIVLTAFAATPAATQEGAVLAPGDAVVTGFSGTKAAVGESLDETFIDLDGASARIRKLEPGSPPSGQIIPAPATLQVKARDAGQVFAIAIDDGLKPRPMAIPANVYLGATSAFGLQIVIPDSDGDGRPERVKKGHPNAEWMAGQFGPSGPGAIYKVDGASGAVSTFATLSGNAGAGVGDIVFDPSSLHFFASDLDTGLIHRIDSAGNILDAFDHGVTGRPAAGLPAVADDGAAIDIKKPAFDTENPATWGFTQPERRVHGLGFRAGRLYYATADGPAIPAIWSVSITLDGAFGSVPRREIEVSGTPANNPITDIAFDNADLMYVAQRGAAKGAYDYAVFAESRQAVVFRFKREIPDDPATPGIWVPIPDEYAVGFPPDHRNTSGGVALGYGYDEAGAVRRGGCDATVWSTGDSLRDGANPTLDLATRGLTVIHGLQGQDRGLVRPDNEPPVKSYFFDFDDRLDDPMDQGHVGDVEILQPCDSKADFASYAPSPSLPPDYVQTGGVPAGETPPGGVPPVGTPEWAYNLRLDKEASPGACVAGGLGFLCDYVVRVTNTGLDAYAGPIVVNDKLPAAPAGAVMTITNAPPWLCVAISPTEQQCTLGPTVLLPGDGVDLFVSVDTPVAAPVCHLDNAASLVWPPGFGDANPADDFDLATATIPAAHCPAPVGEKTNLKIEKTPWFPVCKDKPGDYECSYLIAVRNLGPGVYDGPVKVEDIVPAGTTAEFGAQAGWTCQAAAPYVCEDQSVVLAPNAARFLNVRVMVPKNQAGALGCKVTNTVKIVEALGGADQNTDPTDDEAEAETLLPADAALCPNIVPLNNLKIEKSGPAGPCPVAGSSWECEFKIAVTNAAGAYLYAPVQVLDILPFGTPAGTTIAFQAPPAWQCSGLVVLPNLYGCGNPMASLSPGETMEIVATVKVPVGPVASCSIRNTAQIVKPVPGSLINFLNNDDFADATAQLAPVFPLGGGQGICVSPAIGDPKPPLSTPPGDGDTNLTITKTAGASSATATGQNTTFTITVTNAGPGVFNGPIEVLDTLFDGETVEPSNGSWSAPWTCEGQSDSGHPEQGLCSHPATELDPGESVVLTLEIEAPNSYVAPSGSSVKCGYENRADIATPKGGAPQNTNAGDDSASAEANFEPFEKHGQTFCEPGLTTPAPTACPQGWSRTPVPGKCCPPRSAWDGERCKRGETPPEKECPINTAGDYPDCRCKAGYAGSPPNCRKIGDPESCKITARCMNGRVFSRDACACVCPPGSPWNAAQWRCGTLIADPPRCADGKVWIGGECRCPRGTRWDDGKCRKTSSDPTPACGPNAAGKYPDCRCRSGFTGTPPNCTRIDACKPKTCGRSKAWDQDACACVAKDCPKGTRGVWPNCKPDSSTPQSCPADSVGKPPRCRCKSGTKGTPGDCKRIVEPPKECPKGFAGRPPNCTRIAEPPKRCPAGFVGKHPNCRRVVEPPKRCPRGFTGRPPNCKPIITRRPCPKGMIGIVPNCRPARTQRIKQLLRLKTRPFAGRPAFPRRR